MTPARLPLTQGPCELARFENLYLITDLGQIDLLSQVAGIGDFAQVLRGSVEVDVAGRAYKVLGLEALIRSKEALNRPRDRRAIVQLKALLERVRRGQGT